MKDFENELREGLKDIEIEFDSEEFELKMQEFGKKMKKYGKEIRDSVKKSVEHLAYGSPHIHHMKFVPREKETERAKAKTPLTKIEFLKELLDDGMITQEDYDEKKKKILDEI